MGTASKRLAKARKLRTRTASDLRQLENGHIRIEDVLTDPPATLQRVSVFDILRRTPGLGRTGAEKTLMKIEQWPITKLGNIPLEKRRKIIEGLPPRARSDHAK